MICLTCLVDRPIEDMVKRNDRKIGYRKLCKGCKILMNRDPKVIKQNAQYYQANKDKIRNARKYRRNGNVNERLANSLRSRLRQALKHNFKTGSAVKDLGCSIRDFKSFLESKFQSGMTWDNYGEWHIDHIKPLSLFNLSNREQLLEACSYKNLQPLWAKDNLKKSNKYTEKYKEIK